MEYFLVSSDASYNYKNTTIYDDGGLGSVHLAH